MKQIFAILAVLLGSVPAFAQFNSPVPNMGATATGSWIVPYTQYEDEFCGNTPSTTATIGDLGWDKTIVVGGAGTTGAIASVAGHSCLIQLTTVATATDGVNVSLGNNVGLVFPGTDTNWQAEFIVSPSAITAGNIKIGFMTHDNAAVIPTTGVYVRWLQGTDLSMVICSDTASTETCGTGSTSAGVVPAAGDYVDVYLYSTTSTTIGYKIVDTTGTSTGVQSVTGTICPSGCTVTATVPTTVMSPAVQISELGSSATPALVVDTFAYANTVVK
jgi:hypothetical protein